MPVFGCPDQEINNWKHKSFMMDYHLYSWKIIDGISNLTIRYNLLHLGRMSIERLEIRLCVKERNRVTPSPIVNTDEYWQQQLGESTEWPRGKYDIYMTSDHCPKGDLTNDKLTPVYFQKQIFLLYSSISIFIKMIYF